MALENPLETSLKKLEQDIDNIYHELQSAIDFNLAQTDNKIKNILDEIKDIKIALKRMNTIERDQSATYKNIDALNNYLKALENRIEAIENQNKEAKESKRFAVTIIMMILTFILGLYGSEIKTFLSHTLSFDHKKIEKKDTK